MLSPCYAYLHGNHDHPARNFLGAASELWLEQHGLRILFTHGHECDWIIRRAPQFSSLCIWLGGWLRRQRWNTIYRLGCDLDVAMRMGQETPEVSKFQLWALSLAEARGADVVVTGHTHRPGVRAFGSRMLLNSGTCCEGRFDFLHLDTASATFGFARGP